MVQQHEQVNYQGRKGWVVNVMGNPPNQAITIRFEDGTERVIMASDLESDKGSGLSGKKLNEEQIAGHGGQDRDRIKGYAESGGSTPPLGEGEPEPPLKEDVGNTPPYGIDMDKDNTPNDAGPGTGDTGAGLKSDGKDVDSDRRRILGTEEIIVQIEPVTRKVVDKNGRKLEIGTTISLKARLIKFHGADKVEVLYPPYVRQSGIPVWSEERKRLEIPNQDDPSIGNGAEYLDGIYSYKDGRVVDQNGNEPPKFEAEKQEKIVVKTKYIEKF